MPYIRKLTLKTKLLIYEYKEKYPELSAEFISELFHIELPSVIKLFNEGEIDVPSKMNKEDGRRKKKIYNRQGLLLRRWESPFHERISGKKRPMLRKSM